jgi:hypothetical protein
MSILQIATEYISAGLSVIPIRADGSKAPALATWKPYQSRLATSDELRDWFAAVDVGIAIIAGAVSGNLEVLDFDDGSLLCGCLEEADARAPGIVERLVIVATPSEGWHCFYRSAQIEGNLKLAQHQGEQRVETDIETRGEGGYVLAPAARLNVTPRTSHIDSLQAASLKSLSFMQVSAPHCWSRRGSSIG